MFMTPRQYADDIEALTALIDESGITPVLFEAASQRDVGEMFEFVEQLTKEHTELFEFMEEFYDKYWCDGEPKVFCKRPNEDVEHVEGNEDNSNLVEFPEIINLESFIMLLFLSHGRVSDISLFDEYQVLTSRLSNEGLDELADFQSGFAVEGLLGLVIVAHRIK